MNGRYFLIIIPILILFFQSCEKTVVADTKLMEKDTLIKTFNKVNINGSIRVIFIQDSLNKLHFEAPENLIKNLNVSLSGSTLNITEKSEIENEGIYNLYVYANRFIEIELNDNVEGELSGILREKELKIDLNDNSKFIGDIAINVFELAMKDNSKANFTGTVSTWDLQMEDNSAIIAPNLICSRLTFDMFDVSSAEVHVKKEISGVASDNSKLIYLGTPERDFKSKDVAIIREK